VTTVAFIIGILVMLVGLGVSIALHELGHLVPAKRFGVRVGQYMIGFGPTLFARKRGETEYGLKLLPIGGYISMAGMYPRSLVPETPTGRPAPAEDPGDTGAPAQRRQRFFATLVQDARAANDETLEGADDSRAFFALATWKRVVIMVGGPVMNLVFAAVLFTIVLCGIGIPTASTTVGAVNQCVLPAGTAQTACAPGDPAAPAAAAGLKPGDRIVSIAGQDVSTFDEASAIIRESPGRALAVVIERDGARQTLTVTPLLAERPMVDAQGNPQTDASGTALTQKVGFIGIGPASELVRQPIWAGISAAGQNTGAVIGIVAQLPVKLYQTAESLFTGEARDPNSPLSIVGVGALAGEVAATDSPIINRVSVILQLLASLNIALFVFNLIPLLPLDGGHIAIALWDAVRRGFAKMTGKPRPAPTDATRLVPVTIVVVGILVVMGALLIAADIINPIDLLGTGR
jgi:membrane-associated protease RseP (regulator of RpoE activity)